MADSDNEIDDDYDEDMQLREDAAAAPMEIGDDDEVAALFGAF